MRICWFVAALLISPASAAVPTWTVQTVQGIRLKVPTGWTVTRPQAGLVVLQDPGKVAGSDTAMLLSWSAQPAQVTATVLADRMATQFRSDSGFTVIAQSTQQGVLSRLYLSTDEGGTGYLSVAAFAGKAGQGAWTVAFVGPEARFNDLGGAMFPYAVLGRVSDQQLAQGVASAKKNAVVLKAAAPPAPTAPGPACQVTADPRDSLDSAFNAIAAAGCQSDPHLERIGAILQGNMDAAMSRYEAAMKRYNAAWNQYEQRVTELCSGRNARTQAELDSLQRTCGAVIASTSQSINSWHQTNQGVLYTLSGTPWCYADKYGTCR